MRSTWIPRAGQKLFGRLRSSKRAVFRAALGQIWENLEPRRMLAAVVSTDLPDYAPGSTAYFSSGRDHNAGTNFQVGETLQFQVLRTDGIPDSPPGNLPWNVTDGSDGFAPYQSGDGAWCYPDLDGKKDGRLLTSWHV